MYVGCLFEAGRAGISALSLTALGVLVRTISAVLIWRNQTMRTGGPKYGAS